MTSVARPDHDAAVNVVGTVQVLEAARRAGAQVVFSSTGGAIYGECDGPAREDAPLAPLSPYGIAKLCAEQYLAGWNRIHGTGHVALRFGNVFGPRQEASLEGGVVSIFLERMATREADDDLRRRRPDPRLRLRRRRRRRAARRGRPRRRRLQRRHGPRDERARAAPRVRRGRRAATPSRRFEPPRLGDVRRSVLDVSRAERELGWRAATPLADGLRATWDWVTAGRRRAGLGGARRNTGGVEAPALTPRARPPVAHGDARRRAPSRRSSSCCCSARAMLLLAKPLSRAVQHHAAATAAAPAKHAAARSDEARAHARRTTAAAPAPKLTRAQTSVIVLNGNGRQGAAAAGAARAPRARLQDRRHRERAPAGLRRDRRHVPRRLPRRGPAPRARPQGEGRRPARRPRAVRAAWAASSRSSSAPRRPARPLSRSACRS